MPTYTIYHDDEPLGELELMPTDSLRRQIEARWKELEDRVDDIAIDGERRPFSIAASLRSLGLEDAPELRFFDEHYVSPGAAPPDEQDSTSPSPATEPLGVIAAGTPYVGSGMAQGQASVTSPTVQLAEPSADAKTSLAPPARRRGALLLVLLGAGALVAMFLAFVFLNLNSPTQGNSPAGSASPATDPTEQPVAAATPASAPTVAPSPAAETSVPTTASQSPTETAVVPVPPPATVEAGSPTATVPAEALALPPLEPPTRSDTTRYRVALVYPSGEGVDDNGEGMQRSVDLAEHKLQNGSMQALKDVLPGLELDTAMLELLAARGVEVQFDYYDDKDSRAGAADVARLVAADPTTLCVVGHYSSSTTLEAGEIYEANNKLVITPASSLPALTQQVPPLYRMLTTNIQQAEVGFTRAPLLAGVADQRQLRIAVLKMDDSIFADSLSDEFRRVAGGAVVGTDLEFAPRGASAEMAEVIDKLKALAPQPNLIYFIGFEARLVQLADQAEQAEYQLPPVLGASTVDNPEVIGELRARQKPDGTPRYTISYTTMAAPTDVLGEGNNITGSWFIEEYRAFHGLAPNQFPPAYSAETYDAAFLCLNAIAHAAASVPAGALTPGVVLTAMNDMAVGQERAFPKGANATAAGSYRFNPGRELQSSVVIFREANPTPQAGNIVYSCGAAPNEDAGLYCQERK